MDKENMIYTYNSTIQPLKTEWWLLMTRGRRKKGVVVQWV